MKFKRHSNGKVFFSDLRSRLVALKQQSQRGSTTIYFTIISIAFIGVFFVAISALGNLLKVNEQMRQAQIANRMVLSYYESALESEYGLMAYKGSKELYDKCFKPYFGSDYKVTPTLTMAELESFQKQAIAYGKINVALELVDIAKDQVEEAMKAEKDSKKTVSENEEKNKALEEEKANLSTTEPTTIPSDKGGKNGSGSSASERKKYKEKKKKAEKLRKKLDQTKPVPQSGAEKVKIDSEIFNNKFKFDESTALKLSVDQKLLVIQYLTDYFSTRLTEAKYKGESRCFNTSEIEYILAGSKSQTVNEFSFVTKVFLMRQGVNLLHIVRSVEKMETVSAAALAVGWLFPLSIPSMEAGFIALWASTESTYEIKLLLEGKDISLLKLKETEWLTDFDGNVINQTSKATGTETTTGKKKIKIDRIDYDGYIKVLLMLQSDGEMAARAMNLIDMDRRIDSGSFEKWNELVVSHTIFVKGQTGKEIEFEGGYLPKTKKD